MNPTSLHGGPRCETTAALDAAARTGNDRCDCEFPVCKVAPDCRLRRAQESIQQNASAEQMLPVVTAQRDEMLAALKASKHVRHRDDEFGPCKCSQCEFVALRDAAIVKVQP